ncbi:MAG: polysaccharide biosynthesis tyrosine autokinase [Bacteroidota bacterium]
MNSQNQLKTFPEDKIMDLTSQPFDIKAFISRYLKYWPYFIASISLSLTAAYISNRYAVSRYIISATLLVKDARGSSSGATDFLQGGQLLKTSRNLENEMGIMQSFSMAVATVKQLDFEISYFKDGNVRTSEIYGDNPIRVELDSTHSQLIGVLFEVNPIDNQTFTIKTVVESSWFNDLLVNIGLSEKNHQPFKEDTYRFGQFVEAEQYRFKIHPTINFQGVNSAVQFRINSLGSIAGSYAGRVNVKPNSKGSTILSLSLETTVPNKDKVYLNRFVETYIKAGLDEKNLIAINTIRFINDQLNGVSDSLESVENRLQQFRSANRSSDLSNTSKEVFMRLTELEKELSMQNISAKYYENLITYVSKTRDFKDVIAPTVLGIEDRLTTTLITQLLELYTKRSSLGFSAKDRNLYMAEIDSQIQSLTQQLLENIRNVIRLNQTTKEDIYRRIKLAEVEMDKLPKTERDLVNIKRKFSLNENLYVYLLQKRAEAGIARASNLPDSKIIDSAASSGAIFPNKAGKNRNAILLGLLIPGVIIFLIGYLDNTVSSREQLEKLTRIPVLGVVAHNAMTTNLVLANNPKSAVAETFRSLRSNLQYLASDKERKVILITSSISGEGKTFCAINLASVLALSSKKTLLMGVDLRKPKIFDDFGLQNEKGLSTYLIGKTDKNEVIQKTTFEYLDIITAGPIAPNPAELLMTLRFSELIADLKKDYEYIIFDSPPLGLVADSYELLHYADITLYVVRQKYTKQNMLANINQLASKGVIKNVSLVLNDFTVESKYGYQYGYGYYDDDKKHLPFWRRLVSKIS